MLGINTVQIGCISEPARLGWDGVARNALLALAGTLARRNYQLVNNTHKFNSNLIII